MTYPARLTWNNAKYTGMQLAVCTYPPGCIAWGQDLVYGAFIASTGNVPAAKRIRVR
jgi:hypothetical protein